MRLTSNELAILEMLWREGPVSLSEAHKAIGQSIGYTTVQTRLNRLVEKGAVSRSSDRPALYKAAVSKRAAAKSETREAPNRVCGIDVVPLVAHMVKKKQLSKRELDELKRLIAQAESDSSAGTRDK